MLNPVTPAASPSPRARHLLALGCTVLLAASGCLLGNDSDPPVLSVALYWDSAPEARHFDEASCTQAGVEHFDWELRASDDSVITSRSDQPCRNGQSGGDPGRGFDFVIGLDPDTYTVVVNGYDDAGAQRWHTECDGLHLGRFDTLYECYVDQVPPDGSTSTSDRDAGTPAADEDAGT
jgi:hypothetical protein